MPKDRPPSSMNLPPTYQQKQTILTLLAELRTVAKHEPTNRWEARDFIYKLRIQKKERDNDQNILLREGETEHPLHQPHSGSINTRDTENTPTTSTEEPRQYR